MSRTSIIPYTPFKFSNEWSNLRHSHDIAFCMSKFSCGNLEDKKWMLLI